MDSKQIEADNLLEEAKEIFEGCVKCGLCKGICPTFRYLREEAVSARGMGVVLSDGVMDKIVFECNMCRGCEIRCPTNVKVCEAVRKAREALVLKGKGLPSNEEMIKNIRKSGNPFPLGSDVGSQKSEDKLYCC